jgi:hypothetical protein
MQVERLISIKEKKKDKLTKTVGPNSTYRRLGRVIPTAVHGVVAICNCRAVNMQLEQLVSIKERKKGKTYYGPK